MDSLRYWVTEMHVDGFRFDLAAALARDAQGFQRQSAFLQVVLQDPVLSQVKLIAEPWDITPEGYRWETSLGPGEGMERQGVFGTPCGASGRARGGKLGDFSAIA